MDNNHFQARPNTIPWPPLVLVSAVLTGWLMNRHFPSLAGLPMAGNFLLGQAQIWLGWLSVGLALAMDVWVLLVFRKHKTNIRPDRPAEKLVKTGPFAYSRNPIYLANVVIVAGLAMISGSLWYLMLAFVVFLLIQELAIKREEKHLAARFGDDWLRYRAVVRRWL